MKLFIEFSASIIDECDDETAVIHTEEEIRNGIVETLKEICTEKAKVDVKIININGITNKT